jgi:lysophospholipase L1-like esterase
MQKVRTTICFLLLFCVVRAQDSLGLGPNEIEYISESYHAFVDKVASVQLLEEGKVHILHIGDSHLQADMTTGAARNSLQQQLGNAGRGLVFPYKLADTYGPKDFVVTYQNKWINSWIVHKTRKFEIGLPGIGAKSLDSSGTFSLSFQKDQLQNPYTKAMAIYKLGDGDSSGTVILNRRMTSQSIPGAFNISYIEESSPTNQFELSYSGGLLNLHALFFENSDKGIIYSSFGVTSARYDHYWNHPLFFEELPLIQPDLLIISLGTNESYDAGFTEKNFERYVDSVLSKIQRTLPHMSIMLTTPSENYKIRGGEAVRNTNVQAVNIILRKQAQKHGCALWDMEKAMGGEGSMLRWKKAGLVNKDYVHFLRPGYEMQGRLLAEAIMNSCLH